MRNTPTVSPLWDEYFGRRVSKEVSDAAVEVVLPVMRRENDPRLPQYVAYLHTGRSAWTLQRVAIVIGTSREWARILELRGKQEMADGRILSLEELPRYSPVRKPRSIGPSPVIPRPVEKLLRSLNEDAKQYRKGKDDTPSLMFNDVVRSLIDSGVPLASIARAAGADERGFRKRMTRWGIYANGGPANHPNGMLPKADRRNLRAKELEPHVVPVVAEPTPVEAPSARPCRWPDCPSHLDTGPCIHPAP